MTMPKREVTERIIQMRTESFALQIGSAFKAE